ncbi:MAG: GNAT family N-acetyltransferase [Undibacterium sp.]|uniref:GNAT family N-acetyltransferase n=1 Tax=Undibacterium sp. TaxID=1914977 RepID=UPI00271CBE39|nr:GNAT family N-acetyltransferase [Undibacterium sp.]MDO8651858.1 GNAT family N-acetyltransferase [Undibacterium sp.]
MKKLVISFSSKRIDFRSLTVSDANQTYVDWLNDPIVNQHLEIKNITSTINSCENYIAGSVANENEYLLGMFDIASGKHIGNIKIYLINTTHKTAEIGLMIGEKEFWGQGYATEAIRCVSRWGFEYLNLEKISAGCYEVNLASHKSFLKAGFKVEAFLRSQCIFEGNRIGCFRLGLLPDELT